eukprot:TRINITY_DN3389_c0_g1_i1.p1 TRINITY_DN3389_c0_g1~~TRINITY_DN3389_c0_g1_i1.p1  ORF type:complete len:770 (-),score=223.20 TRINITY_DN3389_c0_g1_i1:51-2360(-)
MGEGDLALFQSIGLDDKRATEASKNAKLSNDLRSVINEAGADKGVDKLVGNVLYSVATKYPANAARHRALLSDLVGKRRVTANNVQAAMDYLKKTGPGELDVAAFERDCGVGVTVTADQMRSATAAFLADPAKAEELRTRRYRLNTGLLMSQMRKARPEVAWADGKELMDELTNQIAAILGPRTAEDDAEPPKEAKAKPAPSSAGASSSSSSSSTSSSEPAAAEEPRFPAPEENTQLDPKLLKEHLSATGGIVVTRFPPEPNGYLHIGHAKAMHLSFGYAAKLGGKCYLRFDDTNPEKESQEYIDSIIDNVHWMGHKPCAITYSSHYFQKLYDLGVDLIKRGLAYVDHQPAENIKEDRRLKRESPWRNRPVEENLKLFDDMRKGKFAEGKATLRMKGDMQNDNPNMRDLIAFRIKYSHHPVSGDDWCVYPSYDFTHCLVDSLENITHSLCTLEFDSRRETYYWLIDALSMYRPLVWEYARLRLTYTVLSKRKLIQLVQGGYVRGWDDPRMATINGFRRKGYTSEAINLFCEKIGVTRANSTIPYTYLEECFRIEQGPKAPRRFCVLQPLKVTLTNVAEGEVEWRDVPNHPADPSMGTHKLPFARTVYIERSDFRLEDAKGYFGLAPGKEVMLKYFYNIRCTDVVKDANGEPIELLCTVDKTNATKVKGVLHWVAQLPSEAPAHCEVRLYETLFTIPHLDEVKDWLSYLNPKSLVICKAIVEPGLKAVKAGDRYQFERVGYFYVDPDTTADLPVFNRTVSLKESKDKVGI